MIGMALGFAAAGVRAGRFMVGVSLLPVRTAWDAAWPQLQARGEAAFEAAFDDALAGPLTEHVARSLGEHRVIERIADELIAKGTVTALFDQALQAGLAEQIADRLLAEGTVTALFDQALQAGLAEQIAGRLLAPDVLDSPLLLEITDRVMASEEMQRVIAHIASSPELRAAITEQTSGLTEEMVAGVRQRTVSLDDVAERTVRGWLRRPRPMTT